MSMCIKSGCLGRHHLHKSHRPPPTRGRAGRTSEDVNDDQAAQNSHNAAGRSGKAARHATRRVAVEAQEDALGDNTDEEGANEDHVKRGGRYSKNAKADIEPDPTQLGFYPPRMRDFIDGCKIEMRTYAATTDPFPKRSTALSSIIPQIIKLMIVTWRQRNKTVEKGFYPEYKDEIAILVFNDLASWRCDYES
ncbi:hypothetical protein BJ138DRAFT_1240155 [Hygrophoropsis aurantiaca]|uniref:Uncharacterized protein n=1 Tax=Hygrophoropsis aurantiaca TaxID=72124 RepID=A0ACB7ZTK7_9AGAM|nr:hypothetical protein BJ138DRAFT_1240155 [Hygrophoropsis aurantiaca]